MELQVVSRKGKYRLVRNVSGMWQIEETSGPYAFCKGRFVCEKAARTAFKNLK